MKANNRIVVDLNKVSYAYYFYRNQYGDRVQLKPTYYSVRMIQFSKTEQDMYGRNLLQHAKARGLLDEWTFVVRLQLANSHRLEYTGEKGQAIWKKWNEKIFKKESK